MQSKSDAQLLREYAFENSELAFAEVVHRHADLLYSAALRQTGSPDAASEAIQRVFIDLAAKAHSLTARLGENASLVGWLYRATRYISLNLIRDERRRRTRETELMQDIHSASESPPNWSSVSPLLDEALCCLDDDERDALLLRFFKNLDFRAVGSALGVSDDTAQKRVSRSLEKLRAALQRRGVTTSTGALAIALAAQAVQAAPAGLAAAWISASLSSAATKTGIALNLLKLMSMTKIQFGIAAIVIGGLIVTVTVQNKTQDEIRGENLALRQQVATLVVANDALSNRLQQAALAPSTPDNQLHELMRLCGEIGLLRDKTNLITKLETENNRLRSTRKESENESENEVFKSVSMSTVNAAKMIGIAFRVWALDNNDKYPTNFAEMHNELGNQTNFAGNVPLDAFEMVNVGKASAFYPQAAEVRERVPRQSPSGGWERVYLLDDGSVQVAKSPDGNFDSWEQNNYVNAFPPAQSQP